VSQKKVPTFKLSVSLLNLNRFLQFCTAEKRTKFAIQNRTTLPTSPYRHVATLRYLEELKIHICRYSADMEENANKLNLCTDFNSSTRVAVYAKRIYVLTEYIKY